MKLLPSFLIAFLLGLLAWIGWTLAADEGGTVEVALQGGSATAPVEKGDRSAKELQAPAVRKEEVPALPVEQLVEIEAALNLDGLAGRVRYVDRSPVPHASISVRSDLGGELRGSADADGRFEIQVPLERWEAKLERIQRENSRSFERAWERHERRHRRQSPGLLEHKLATEGRELSRLLDRTLELRVTARDRSGYEVERMVTVPRERPRPMRVDLVLERRLPFGGQVLGLEGPEELVDVRLYDEDWNLVSATQTDEEGVFVLRSPAPGPYRIHARKQGAGTAYVNGIWVGSGVSGVHHQLSLGGDEHLRGQLLTSDGDPVPDIEMVAVASGLALQNPRRPAWPTAQALGDFERNQGLGLLHLRTDPEGRFSMRGVQEGTFQVIFAELPESLQPRGLYRTGVDNEVRFLGRILFITFSGDKRLRRQAVVHVVSLEKPRPPRKAIHVVERAAQGCIRMVVEPDSLWGISYQLGGEFSRQRELLVPDDRAVTFHELRLWSTHYGKWSEEPQGWSRPSTKGSLEVTLQDPDGQLVKARVTLWREDGASPRRLFHRRLHDADSPLPALEPGVYRYAVESPAAMAAWTLPLEEPRPVALRAGETRRVSARLESAGRLRLLLEPAAGLDAAAAFRARLVPRGATGGPVDLTFGGGGGASVAVLSPGVTTNCEPALAVGEYDLELHDEDGVRATRRVEITAGEWTELRVSLGEPR